MREEEVGGNGVENNFDRLMRVPKEDRGGAWEDELMLNIRLG